MRLLKDLVETTSYRDDVRSSALDVLGELDVPGSHVAEYVKRFLGDNAAEVRVYALFVLGKSGNIHHIEHISRLLSDDAVVESGRLVSEEAKWAIAHIIERRLPSSHSQGVR
ncbi:MAG TPA: hypothetical protein VFQ91_04730 [Bryobacteraceae bacterium]|nr:hypothetical protein [Bryobacteraceae bacterium]